jgi:hypothetical protein
MYSDSSADDGMVMQQDEEVGFPAMAALQGWHADQPAYDAFNTEQPDLVVKWRESAHSTLQPAAIAASLAMFAILGTLTRLAIFKLATYNGMSVYPEILVQAVGCAVMGLVVKNKVMLES